MNPGVQALLVVRAQLQMYRNTLGRRGTLATFFNFIATGMWYTGAAALAWLLASYFSSLPDMREMLQLLVIVLLGITIYWQLSPIISVSFGLALDLKRLLIFPIPFRQYFLIELLLCVPRNAEMLLLSGGVIGGLLANPRLSKLAVIAVGVLFLAFNFFLNIAIRAIVAKLSRKRLWREIAVLAILAVILVPSFLLQTSKGQRSLLDRVTAFDAHHVLPWSAAASAFAGDALPPSIAVLGVWTLVAFVGARGLFYRSLHAEFDSSLEPSLASRPGRTCADLRARVASLISRPLPQPLSALIEKEFLTLTRSPRFITVFIMGFTFGIIVFLPLAANTGGGTTMMSRNFLTVVTAYAILLMSEMAFWNIFGLDRQAAQVFFFAPVSLRTVFFAKNIVAFLIIGVQVFIISLVCALIGMKVTLTGVAEAVLAAIVLTINMFAVGNQSSVRYPMGVNPQQSWNASGQARYRVVLMMLFPIVSLPTSLAYLARWAFRSDAAFYAGMTVAAMIAIVFYLVSLDSAIDYATRRREHLVGLLGNIEAGG